MKRFASAAALCPLLAMICVQAASRGDHATPRRTGNAGAAANFDVRVSPALKTETLGRLGRGSSADILARVGRTSAATARLREALPDAIVTLSVNTGGAQLVSSTRGALTPPAAGDSRVIVDRFVRSNASLYGLDAADVSTLRIKDESVSRSGLRMVRADQMINGIPVFQSDARFVLDAQGRLIRTIGAFVPAAAATAAGATPVLSPAAALVAAMRSVGVTIDASDVASTVAGTQERLTVASPDIKGDVTSTLVYFPVTPGVVTLAYQQFAFTRGPGDYLIVVDASTGAVLWRKNARAYQSLPTQDARFAVYVQADGKTPADSPAPLSPTNAAPGSGTQAPEIARTIVSMSAVQDPVASPAGWMPDGVTTTTGNNVDACTDRVVPGNVCDATQLDNSGRPVGNPDTNGNNRDFLGNAVRDFNGTPPPQGGDPEAGTSLAGSGLPQDAIRRISVTQLFYVVNWYHDQLFRLGFDEAAGNFQTANFSGQGLGNDAVIAEVQDVTNTAFMSTPADGSAPRLQLRRLPGPDLDRDMALDTEMVLHELTHGVTQRLIGNGSALQWLPGAGLGEGWSDFIALSLLNNSNADDPNGRYAFGAYGNYKREFSSPPFTDNYVYGERRYPYTTDNTINPLQWSDIDDVTSDYSGGMPISPLGFEKFGGLYQHNVGEIWALTLWEVRGRIIADPAGANGDVPTGNRTMLQLVLDAIKLTPPNPTFVEARDALLQADCATNACANERSIWEGFADRGFGYGAAAPLVVNGAPLNFYVGHMSLRASNTTPRLDLALQSTTIDDSLGNNNGAIDPGEPVRLGLTLQNPFRNAAFNATHASATLTTSTPGVTIINGSTTFGALPVQGSAPGTPLMFRVDQASACGSAIDFTLTVTSSLGTSSSDFLIRVGTASGTAAPVTYSRTALGLVIPDGVMRGVTDALTITDDYEIADLDFRVDSLQHTWVGDVSLLLRSPQGYGSDLIFGPGLATIDGAQGDHLIDVTISDQATGDLGTMVSAQQPYTGEFLPFYNSPSFTSLTGRPTDPLGQLSRHNGTRTKGTWHVLVSDFELGIQGTLQGWSMIVTPRAFTCAPFADATLPLTTTTLTPPAPGGDNGWYTSPVLTAISAADVDGLVVETRCALDLASAPATFNDLPSGCAFGGAGASVAADGAHVLYAASADASGNLEAPVQTAFKIDRTAPLVQCALPAPAFAKDQAGAMVTATVTDATSGPVSSQLSVAAATATAGAKTAAFTGRDLAGNETTVNCAYTVNAPAPEPLTYFLAEGSTGSFFSTDVALANPHAAPAPITVTFLKGDGTTVVENRTLPATSRTTIAVREVAGLESTPLSTIVSSLDGLPIGVERTMAWDARSYGGHGEAAIAQLRPKWYFSEGSSGFFNTYILVVNPNAEATTATLTFMTESGAPVAATYPIGAFSRLIVDTGSIAELTDRSFGFTVEATQPIAVERSMYFGNTPAHLFTGGHAASGAADPGLTWYFAEGATGAFFDTYILLSNPGASPARVTLTYLLDDGTTVVEERAVAANGRTTVSVESGNPRLASAAFSTQVISDVPIVAERSMYWGDGGASLPWTEGHNSIGVTAPGLRWLLAEGRVGGPLAYQTYILLGNPSTSTAAEVTMTYLRTDGSVVTKAYVVPPTSRVNVCVNDVVSELRDESFAASISVTNDVPIFAERSLYWNADGVVWAGGTNAPAVRMP